MLKLLRNNIYRLARSKSFYIFLVAEIAIIVFSILYNYDMIITMSPPWIGCEAYFSGHYLRVFSVEGLLPTQAAMICVFGSLFICADYKDGAIRNKISAGHSRVAIYFSNLITVSLFAIAVSFVGIIAVSVFGIPLLPDPDADFSKIMLTLVCGIFSMLTYASIITAAAMLLKNTTATVIASLLTLTIAMIIFVSLDLDINRATVVPDYIYNEAGELIGTEYINNPDMLSERAKAFYMFILNLFPGGQNLLANIDDTINPLNIAYSVCLIAVVSTAGCAAFARSDIK